MYMIILSFIIRWFYSSYALLSGNIIYHTIFASISLKKFCVFFSNFLFSAC